MISFKENRIALLNLGATVDAINHLDLLIKYYSEDKPGPAYMKAIGTSAGDIPVQIDRDIMLIALCAQNRRRVDYLTNIGIDYDE